MACPHPEGNNLAAWLNDCDQHHCLGALVPHHDGQILAAAWKHRPDHAYKNSLYVRAYAAIVACHHAHEQLNAL